MAEPAPTSSSFSKNELRSFGHQDHAIQTTSMSPVTTTQHPQSKNVTFEPIRRNHRIRKQSAMNRFRHGRIIPFVIGLSCANFVANDCRAEEAVPPKNRQFILPHDISPKTEAGTKLLASINSLQGTISFYLDGFAKTASTTTPDGRSSLNLDGGNTFAYWSTVQELAALRAHCYTANSMENVLASSVDELAKTAATEALAAHYWYLFTLSGTYSGEDSHRGYLRAIIKVLQGSEGLDTAIQNHFESLSEIHRLSKERLRILDPENAKKLN